MASERIDEQSHHQQTTDPGPSTPIPSSPSTHQQHQQEDITPKHSRIQSNRGHSSSDSPHKKHGVNDEQGVDDDDVDVNDDAAMAAATAVSAPALNASFPSSTSRPPLMSKNSSNMGGGTFELPPMPVPFEDFHFSLDLPDNIQASDLSLLQSSDFDSLFGGGAASAGVGSSSGGNLTPSLMSSSALFGSMTPAVRTPAALQPGNGEDAVMTSAPMSAKASQQHAKAQAMPARPQENAEGFFSFDSLFGDQQRQQGQSSQQHQQSQQSQQPGMHPGMQPGSSQQPSQTLSEAQQAPLFDTSESDFLSNFLEGFESSWDFNPALPENMPSFAAAAAQHSARGAPYGADGRTPNSVGGASSSSGSVMGASPGQYPNMSAAARRRGRTTSRTSNDFPSPMRDGSNGLQMESAAFSGGMNGSNPITSLGHAAFGGHLDGMEEDEGDVQGAATGSKRGVTQGNNGRLGGEKRRGSLAQTQAQALGGPNGYGGPYGTGAGPPMFFPPQQYGVPGQPWPSPGHMGGGAPSPYGASPGRMHMMPGHPHHPHHPGHPATPAFAQPAYSPRHGGPPPLPPPQMSASPHSMQAMPNNSKKGGPSSSAAAIAAAAAKKAEEDEAAAKRELLTDREKRQNHILSEQRRRNHIREGFTELVALLDLGRWHGARGLGLSSGAGTGIEDEGLDDRSEVSSDEESDEEMKALAKSRRKKAKAKRMAALSAATAASNGRTPSLTSLSASKGKGKGRGRGGSAGGGAGSKSAVLFQAVDLIKWLEVSNDKILRQCELLEEKAGCGEEPVEVVSAKAKAKGADSKAKEQGQPAAAAAVSA